MRQTENGTSACWSGASPSRPQEGYLPLGPAQQPQSHRSCSRACSLAGSPLLWKGPLPQRAASRGGAGEPASEPPWAVSPLCGFSWGPTGLAGLVPKLR